MSDNSARAMTLPQSGFTSPRSRLRPSGMVNMSRSVSATRGQAKSFQRHMKVKITNTAMIGFDKGRTMRKKMVNSPAPSRRAASISSSGDADHELAHHEDSECLRGAGQDHAKMAVQQAKPGDDQEFRYQDHLDRHHQSTENSEEQDIAAGEVEFGEGVAA